MPNRSPQARLDLIEHINDQVDVFLAYVDRDLRYVYNNAQYQRWFSRSLDDLRGRHVREVVGERRWSVVEERYRRALAGETVTEVNSYRFPGGSDYWGRIEFRPDVDPQTSEVRGILIVVSDVTALKEVEQELEERVDDRSRALFTRGQQLRSVADSVPAGIAFFDPEGRCEFANRTLCDWLDRPIEDLHGQPIGGVLRGAPPTFLEAASAGRDAEAEAPLVSRSDPHTPRLVELHAVPLSSPDGRPATGGTTVLAHDLTERRRRREHANSLYARMGETQRSESLALLTRGLAHDFKNLLQAVVGNLSLAVDVTRDASIAPYLDNAQLNAEQASEFCAELLAFSGDRPARSAPVDLAALTHEVTKVVARRPDSNHVLRVEPTDDLPPIPGNEVQLKRLLFNLLINAQQATQEEGQITVTLERRQLDESLEARPRTLEPGPYLLMTVRDTGHGMDRLTRDRLFETFYTTRPKGQGLGLAAVLSIVQTHAGGIRVESQVGEGTAFEVWLPSDGARQQQPAAGLPDAPGDMVERGWALVARHDLQDLLVSAEALRQHGFRVMTATDGQEAIDHARRLTFDFALIDPALTGFGALEPIEALREIQPDLPLILATGGRTSSTLVAPAAAVLTEPWHPQELLAVIDRLLDDASS